MLGGGGVGEMKDLYCKDSGVLKGALKETRFLAGFFFFWVGEGGVTLLNIESIGGSQIRDWEEEGEGLPFPVVFFVVLYQIR